MSDHPKDSKPRLLLWDWSTPDSRLAIDRLKSEGLVEIPVWFADSDRVSHPYRRFLFNQPPFPKQCSLPARLRLTSDELLAFFEMFSRTGRGNGISIQEYHNIAQGYFSYFHGLLLRERITHMAFSLLPCPGFDYLAYLAGRRLGVKIVMCMNSIIPNRFFYIDHLEDFGSFHSSRIDNPDPVDRLEFKFHKNLFYMTPKIIKKDHANENKNPWWTLVNDLRRFGLRKSSRPKPIAGIFRDYADAQYFRKAYRAQCQHQVDLDAPFVYFGLQLQPELTTATLGGKYADQLSAIEAVREMIPDDWFIYVKENPKQGFSHRGPNFFSRLSSIPKAVYVSKQFDTYELLEHCKFPATITGTVGWESITGLKPALVFGRTWYDRLPGVVKFREDLTYQEVMSTIIHPARLEEAYQRLMRKSHNGIIDMFFTRAFPLYNQSTNVSCLYDFLKAFLTTT